jgi:hypothetical protein
VKLQLTKDKTIEIKFPSGGAKSVRDITGIELFATGETECPAIRLVYKKKSWHIAASGFAKLPNGELPMRWEDTPHQPVWEMPHEFTSPHAALAVNSPMATFAQSTADAVVQDMMAGLAAQDAKSTAGDKSQQDGKRRFGIKREQSAPPAKKPSAQQENSTRKPPFPGAGTPVSENGRRFVVRPMAEENFHLCASLPEFQTLWLSRLLPEGKRPTTSSIQVAESALMASILLQPEFIATDGNALAIFMRPDATYLAGYKKGEPVLWRRCPGVGGALAMRDAVRNTLGLDEELVDSVLNESLIDPRPALEPFVRPILSQLSLSLDYLTSKHGLKFDHAFLMGVGAGTSHWSTYAEESLHLKLISPNPFEGLELEKGVDSGDASRHLVALGAAIAGAEVNA